MSLAVERDEVAALFDEYARTRSPDIRDRLVEAHIGLAASLANRFTARHESPDDLYQAAMVGLLHAIERYDPTRGVQFTTFAWATITGELKRHFRDRTWAIRVSRRVQEHYLMTAEALDSMTAEFGRSPTVAEIAERTGLTVEDVVEALEARNAHRLGSIDAPANRDDGPGIDPGEVDGGFLQVEHRQVISTLVGRLSPREQQIIHLRFGEELTQAEIAKVIGVSQMHVSRLLAQSLNKLRGWAEAS